MILEEKFLELKISCLGFIRKISFIEMGGYVTENSRTVSAVSSIQRQKKQSFNVGDKSHHVPCQRCENCCELL